MNKRIFVDMDGTIAEWRLLPPHVDPYKEIQKENYFYTLNPYTNVLEAIKELTKSHDVYILSAVISDDAIDQKNRWLDKHLPEIGREKRIFSTDGLDKRKFVPKGVSKQDYLIDDRSLNLHDWNERGTGIKLMNGLNGTKGTWKGHKVYANKHFKEIYEDIKKIIEGC